MLSPSYSISPKDLWNAIATPRRRNSSMCGGAMPSNNRRDLLPGALWRDAGKTQAGRANSIAPGRSWPPARPAMK